VERAAVIEVGGYRLGERLGQGGTGQVYRGDGPSGAVAVKILSPHAELDPATKARFAREVKALGQLQHPNIVPLIDHGFDEELGPFLVMPLLQGGTLRNLIAGQALGPEAALLLTHAVVSAVTVLHDSAYIHRDLKPENIMVTSAGQIVVIDFGLAFADGMTKHTDTGAAAGTIGYMSPEQIEGHRVDAASDVFAIGVMLYEWICGKRPFARARANEEVAATLAGRFTSVAQIDRRCSTLLNDLITACLSSEKSTRPSAAQLQQKISAELDWIDTGAADSVVNEIALVCSDATGYQSRVSRRKMTKIMEQAETAQVANRPFVALALCDRALAYAREPEDVAAVQAFVRNIESVETLPVAADNKVAIKSTPAAETPAEAAIAVVQQNTGETRRPKWQFVIGAASAFAVLGILATIWIVRSNDAVDSVVAKPPSPANTSVTTSGLLAGGTIHQSGQGSLDQLSGMLTVVDALMEGKRGVAAQTPSTPATIGSTFGQMATVVQKVASAAKEHNSGDADRMILDGQAPSTATGWLETAAKQKNPAQELAAVRNALALSPTWDQAKDRLCSALAKAGDDTAVEECTAAITRHPAEEKWIGFRGMGYLHRGLYAAALKDFDQVIAVDDAPVWLAARAVARQHRGDVAGANRDLKLACERKLQAACDELKR
jgi:Protein kinase domain